MLRVVANSRCLLLSQPRGSAQVSAITRKFNSKAGLPESVRDPISYLFLDTDGDFPAQFAWRSSGVGILNSNFPGFLSGN